MSAVPVPVIVLSSRQDDVELINKALRDHGLAAHCHWIDKIPGLDAAIKSLKPHLLWVFCDNFAGDLRVVANLKRQASASLPVIAVKAEVSEQEAVKAMASGANDLISGKYMQRLCAVARRELRAFQLERALRSSTHSARKYKEQLRSFMEGAVDAIAYVNEGILVEANQAWLDLFERDADDLVGPMMDLFDTSSHAAIKGALVASAKGQWSNEPLKVTALTGNDSKLQLAMLLESSHYDGEPAIKLSIPRDSAAGKDPEDIVDQAVSVDATTGIYHRQRLSDLLTERLSKKASDGTRALAYIRPDKFGTVCGEVGPIASEEILVSLAEILNDMSQPNDICGRFGGNVFVMWLERGTLRDIEAWAEHVLKKIADTRFETGGGKTTLTCTIGLCEVGPNTDELELLVKGAQSASQRARQRGGNQAVLDETTEETTRTKVFDSTWVQNIKSALVENRLQLGLLPIANLNAEAKKLYDTILKIIGPDGDEIGASTFIPVASRHNLLRTIDRWVINNTLAMTRNHTADCVFIRLSSDSVADAELIPWLRTLLNRSQFSPDKLCFQISEETAIQYLHEAKELSRQMSELGFKFAVEHFGIGRDPKRVMGELTLDYLKIDGSLMQGLSNAESAQEEVAELISEAHNRGIRTIGERVEDANTMAVLFQLGVGYIEGHYVHEPEVVLEDVLPHAV